jgi:hypothetical protein
MIPCSLVYRYQYFRVTLHLQGQILALLQAPIYIGFILEDQKLERRYCGGSCARGVQLRIFRCNYGLYLNRQYWLRAERPRGRSSSPGRAKNFHFSMPSRRALGPTRPPVQWVPGALSPEVKQLGCDADHSPPTSAEVKKMWINTSTPPYAFVA